MYDSMFFQIPNSAWLVEHGWIDKKDKDNGPFFVKKLQILPIPTFSRKRTISIKLTNIQNLVKGKNYVFGEEVSNLFSYTENFDHCDKNHIHASLYSNKNCREIPDYCQHSDGMFSGPLFPSLLSKWILEFNIPEKEKDYQFYPIGPFSLKVKAEICFRDVSKKKSSVYTRANPSGVACCATLGKFLNRSGDCDKCPEGSSPRFEGFFCEACPAGYEPKDPGTAGYGCIPCPVDSFKSNTGNLPCISCKSEEHTQERTGCSFCVGRDDLNTTTNP